MRVWLLFLGTHIDQTVYMKCYIFFFSFVPCASSVSGLWTAPMGRSQRWEPETSGFKFPIKFCVNLCSCHLFGDLFSVCKTGLLRLCPAMNVAGHHCRKLKRRASCLCLLLRIYWESLLQSKMVSWRLSILEWIRCAPLPPWHPVFPAQHLDVTLPFSCTFTRTQKFRHSPLNVTPLDTWSFSITRVPWKPLAQNLSTGGD